MDMSGTWSNGLTANCPPFGHDSQRPVNRVPRCQAIPSPRRDHAKLYSLVCHARVSYQVPRCQSQPASAKISEQLHGLVWHKQPSTYSVLRTHIKILGQPRTFGPVGWSTTLSSSVSPRTGHCVLYDSSGCQDLVDGDSQSANVDLRGHTAAPIWTS